MYTSQGPSVSEVEFEEMFGVLFGEEDQITTFFLQKPRCTPTDLCRFLIISILTF